jgi:Tat protein secretion system quality control protein TatD with DNase activity
MKTHFVYKDALVDIQFVGQAAKRSSSRSLAKKVFLRGRLSASNARLTKDIPLDRLMIETDAPFLTPRNISPKPKDMRNEPAYLPYVGQMIAQCTGHSVETIADATTENALWFFALNDAPSA